MDKIIKICMKNGFKYTLQPLKYGYTRAEIICNNHYEREAVFKAFKRQNVKIDWERYGFNLWIYNAAEYADIERRNNSVFELTELFCKEMHNGKTAAEARKIQEEYAENHGLIEAYNQIYA